MIPILFDEKATTYRTNGIGRLTDAISCIVTEERNGGYELEMEYPITGSHYADITLSKIIAVIPHDGGTLQGFRIYKISKPLNGIITVYAEHVSYQLTYIPIAPFTANNVSGALATFESTAKEVCPFTFWTDKTTSAKFSVTEPCSIRSRLGGVQGSILDVYGGEWEFDNYTARLWNHRGNDNGVVLRYGKNITDIRQDENIASTITGILPYWKKETTVVTGAVVRSENADAYPFHRTVAKDFTTDFEDKPTAAQLEGKARAYLDKNGGAPSVSISVNFVPLWYTDEYKDIANLERLHLCDTVTVIFEKLGVNAKAKVVKTVYDVLKDRYRTIDVGETRSNLSVTLAENVANVEELQSTTFLENAARYAADLINSGADGGYVTIVKNADGVAQELVISDTPNYLDATKVWRWNMYGLGFQKGYNADTYPIAITMDGRINADFITSGTIKTVNLKGCSVIVGGSEFEDGEIICYDAENNFCAALNKYGLQIEHGNIDLGNGNFLAEDNGKLTAKNADIKGKITATSGSIGGNTIESGQIHIKSGLQGGGLVLDSAAAIGMYDAEGQGFPILQNFAGNSPNIMLNAMGNSLHLGYMNTVGIECGRKGYVMLLEVFGDNADYGDIVCHKVTQTSDRRSKHDIEQLQEEDAHRNVMLLNPVAFKMNGKDRTEHGFIAQDVQEIGDPFGSVSESRGRLSISYTSLIADLVGSIQHLTHEIETLKEAKNAN